MLEFKSKTECIFGASFLEAGTCVLHAFLQPKCHFFAKNLSIPGGGYHIYIYIYVSIILFYVVFFFVLFFLFFWRRGGVRLKRRGLLEKK